MGTIFSTPTTLISVSGRVRHIRPLPSDSTTTSVPVSAMAKFAPEMPTFADMNLRRRCVRAAAASSRGSSVRSARRARHLAQEDLADLGPVAVDRGHQDVAGQVVVELDDQLGEVGLQRGDALGGEGLVHAHLLGGHRLDLDHLVGAGLPHQVGDDPRWPRRRHGPSAPARPRPSPRPRTSRGSRRGAAAPGP